jgi:recombination protein RecA
MIRIQPTPSFLLAIGIAMPRNLAALRLQVETALAGRVSAPFTYRDRKLVEMVSAGIPEIDALTGGLPRGGLTEICGPPCSGRTSLLVSALASRTAHAEVCALVDGRDAFDPHAAAAAGVKLDHLLWVRCRNIDQALRSTDLLLQGGGFGMIAVDLTDIPPATVRYVPLNAWFRFRRAVEDTPTILVLLDQEPNAKTCASLVLRLGAEPPRWSRMIGDSAKDFRAYPSACLLDGFDVRAEVVSSRVQLLDGVQTAADGGAGVFETRSGWGCLGVLAEGMPGETSRKSISNFKFHI